VVVQTEVGQAAGGEHPSKTWAPGQPGRCLGLRYVNPTRKRHCDDRLAFNRISQSLIPSSLIRVNFFVIIQTVCLCGMVASIPPRPGGPPVLRPAQCQHEVEIHVLADVKELRGCFDAVPQPLFVTAREINAGLKHPPLACCGNSTREKQEQPSRLGEREAHRENHTHAVRFLR